MTAGAAGAAILLAAAFASDIRTMRIPNRLNVAALAAGLLFHALAGAYRGLQPSSWDLSRLPDVLHASGHGLLFALSGAATGFALMLFLYRLGAIGGGDVKLFAALGSWIGMTETLDCAMYAVLAAGLYGLLCLVIGRQRAVRWKLLRLCGNPDEPVRDTGAADDAADAADADEANADDANADDADRGIEGADAAAYEKADRDAAEIHVDRTSGQNAGNGRFSYRFPFMIAVIPGMIAAWLW